MSDHQSMSLYAPVLAERPCPTLDRMVRLGGLTPSAAVAVAGPARIAAQIGLLRKGFGRVVCACSACGGEAESWDALLITGPVSDLELSQLAGRNARLLKPTGVVVAHEASVDADWVLGGELSAHGLEIDWVIHDMAGSCLVAFGVHRCDKPARMSLAA